MYLLYTDETNFDPRSSDFFIYGGIAIPSDNAEKLSSAIEQLRKDYGYRSYDVLKFNTVEKPKHISKEAHKDIKNKVIAETAKHGIALFTSFILHRIASSPSEARRNEINRICYHYDLFLSRLKESGLVLIDTFNERNLSPILKEKFSVGIRGLPYTPILRLDKVLGFHSAMIGSSHFCSVVDIVLGSMRFAINNRNDASKNSVVKTLLQQLSPLFIRYKSGGKVSELSLFFSPKVIKAKTYLEEYKKLYEFLTQNGIEAEQEITNMRKY